MAVGKHSLFTVLVWLLISDKIGASDVGDQSQMKQYFGRWYEIGRISSCIKFDPSVCHFYQISEADKINQKFYIGYFPIKNITSCEYGIPIYTYFVSGTLNDSRIIVGKVGRDYYVNGTIKNYANNNEIIVSESQSELCATPSYRLLSRDRRVSAETQAEFEKLAEDQPLIYFDWDYCPSLRSETDNNFTVKQLEGLWYEIAKIYSGNEDNDTCTTYNIVVDHEHQTFNYTVHTITHGNQSEFTLGGSIKNSVLHFEPAVANGESFSAHVVGCNNYSELIIRMDYMPHYAILSRNPKVPVNFLQKVEVLSLNYKDSRFTVCPQDSCPNRDN